MKSIVKEKGFEGLSVLEECSPWVEYHLGVNSFDLRMLRFLYQYMEEPLTLGYIANTTGWSPDDTKDSLIRLINLDYVEFTSPFFYVSVTLLQACEEVQDACGEIFWNLRINSKKLQPKTFVYVAKDGHTGLYKIGKSKNPGIREKTLLAVMPLIEFVFIRPESDEFTEKILHEEFAHKRKRGEWFELEPFDLIYISENFQ